MPAITDKSHLMHEVVPGVYVAENGFTARCEDGLTPNGNPVGRRWVLRDGSGAYEMHVHKVAIYLNVLNVDIIKLCAVVLVVFVERQQKFATQFTPFVLDEVAQILPKISLFEIIILRI